jgi:acyl-CoA synthetase (AMP-forming)/AMP-acid ligase II
MLDQLHTFSLGDLIREHRRSRHRECAVVCGEVRLTFAEMDARVNSLAQVLGTEGVSPGSRVLWLGQNCHRALETLFACAKLGAVFVPVNWRQSAEEIAFVVDDARPDVVVWQEEEVADAARAARRVGSAARWICHDSGEYEDLVLRAGDDDDAIFVDPNSAVLQMYTAAFEGRPNGALLSHQAILIQDLVLALMMGLSADDVYLASGPLFHIWTFLNSVATLHMGGKVVVTRRVEAETMCRLVDQEQVTRGFILEPTRSQMVEVNRDGRFNLKSLKASPAGPEWTAMITPDPSGWGTHPGMYGQTEVTAIATTSSLGGASAGRNGRSSPVAQVRIVDPDGRDLASGEVGEIVCRGPVVMLGYHDRQDVNAARQRDGWHHTHDLGRREEDGSITFIGPMSDMIKSAAENIYPAEVEACLLTHPSVAEACVIGVPDPQWVQSVEAVVVLRPDSSATAEEIIEHCRTRISSYKKPRYVEFVPSLPRGPAGVDRTAVNALYGGGGYPGSAGG